MQACPDKEPECKICNDIGMVLVSEDPLTYRRCACMASKAAHQRMVQSGLGSALDLDTFDSFRTDTDYQREMKDKAIAYVDALKVCRDNPRRPWFFVSGSPGCGKTHICTAVCGELLELNLDVRYMQWVSESRKLKAHVNDDDFDSQIENYTNVKVLYIDDFLKQTWTINPHFTEADIRLAFAILNARYVQNLPTIISTEWDIKRQLLPFDEATFSRVYERSRDFMAQVGRNPGNNYRLMA